MEARSMEGRELSEGVSWTAVIAGAAVTSSISLIMLALGAGFGLEVISPWSSVGASASAIGGAAIAWLIVNELISCSLGGYLAGRLRTRWITVHTDEVHFRDTANGFLVWALAVVLSVTLLVSAAAFMAGSSVNRETSAASPRSMIASTPMEYYVDRLFRSDSLITPNDAPSDARAGRLFANIIRQKETGGADEDFLAKLVAARTGLGPAEAAERVSQVLTDARQAEDTARQTAAHLLLWTFLALLIGAFSASYAATIGGRQRDRVRPV